MSLRPVRGPAVRELGLRLPPARMAPLHRRRPLKRWRYVAVYGPELMLCVGDARVAGVPQRWWAVALPDGTLLERTTSRRVDRCRAPGWILISEPEVRIELTLDEADGVEVVSPHGGGWIWTRKQAGVPVRGRVMAGGREWPIDGPLGFVDDSAGYHARHTRWRWSAGVGRALGGEAVAWNLVEGVHDAAEASERTVWVDGEPREVGGAAVRGGPVAGRRARLRRVVGARGSHPARTLPERLPPAVRRLLRRPAGRPRARVRVWGDGVARRALVTSIRPSP